MSKQKHKKNPEPQIEEAIENASPIPASLAPVKLSFIKLAFSPFATLVDNFKRIFLLSLPYALLISAISLVFGFGYICKYSQFMEVHFYCSTSNTLFTISFFINMFLFSLFVVKYHDYIISKNPFSYKNLISIDRRSFKVFGFFIVSLLIWTLPLISSYLLFISVPNPNWKIELAYFAVVSIGFVAPFAALRFLSYLSFLSSSSTAPSLRTLWTLTQGSTLKIMLSIFLIFILFIFVVFQFYVNFMKAVDDAPIYIGIVSTFLYNLSMLIIFSIFINHCAAQKQLLQE